MSSDSSLSYLGLRTTTTSMAKIDLRILRGPMETIRAEYSPFLNSPRTLIALASIAALLLVSIARIFQWMTRKKLRLKNIVLADEISSSRARALAYCYRPREVMLKGYKQFPDEVYGIDTRDGELPREYLMNWKK
jgi:hypothetical protein